MTWTIRLRTFHLALHRSHRQIACRRGRAWSRCLVSWSSTPRRFSRHPQPANSAPCCQNPAIESFPACLQNPALAGRPASVLADQNPAWGRPARCCWVWDCFFGWSCPSLCSRWFWSLLWSCSWSFGFGWLGCCSFGCCWSECCRSGGSGSRRRGSGLGFCSSIRSGVRFCRSVGRGSS